MAARVDVTVNELDLGLVRQRSTVLFGPGQRRQLPAAVSWFGDRALVCTDKRMANDPVYVDLVGRLKARGIDAQIYSKVEPDLPRENLLDLYGENVVDHSGIPVITVPTTGGTGAEVTCISVVYDADRGMTIGVASPYLEPAMAIVDPELTLTCPPGLTAATGADALTHLVEAFSGRAKNPDSAQIEAHLYVGKNLLTDLYCRHGLSLANSAFERVVADPADLAARTDKMMAAFCAGMAINTAGTAGAHAIQSPIGALTHTAHGLGVGALLPYVMRYNFPVRVEEFAEIGRILGVADSFSLEAQAQAGIRRVEELLDVLGCPLNLKVLGLEPDQFEYVADQALLATRLTGPETVLASSSSAISASRIGDGISAADRILVGHPGNPPYLLRPEVVKRATATYASAGLHPVQVRREIEGFVFNRLQGAVLREAYCLVRDGVATVADIDAVVRLGLGRRWGVVGPLEAVDLNTRGGIGVHAGRMGPAYARMGAERGQDEPWTDELVAEVVRQRRELMPLDAWEQRVLWRDERLMDLITSEGEEVAR